MHELSTQKKHTLFIIYRYNQYNLPYRNYGIDLILENQPIVTFSTLQNTNLKF